MIKNQKGITVTILVMTITVMIILMGVTINVSSNLIRSSEIKSYMVTMNLIKLEVEKIYEDYEFNEDASKLSIRGATKVDASTVSGILSARERNLIMKSDSTQYWYRWTKETLATLEIDYTNMLKNTSDCFYVNYKTGEIVYSAGYTDGNGTTVHSLTGLSEIL